MRTLDVDFNQIQDDDTIRVTRRRIGFVPDGAVGVGSAVQLRDYDGDSCLGRIAREDARAIYVVLDLRTWQEVSVRVHSPVTEGQLLLALSPSVQLA